MLTGEKVNLRAIDPTDLDNCLSWVNDREVTRFLSTGLWPVSRKSEEEWLQRRATSNDPAEKVLAIDAKDGTYLGNIGLHKIDFPAGTAELGIVIGRKDYWGRGYGTDAAKILLRHAFDNLRLRKVMLTVLGSNVRAQKSYLKLGFKQVGCLKAHLLKEGQFEDLTYMEVFKEEFEQACK
jgi:RimJ/RimL family protein N-acetyltransferase